MKKIIYVIYGIFVVILIAFTTYTFIYDSQNNTRKYPSDSSVTRLTKYKVESTTNGTSIIADYEIDPDYGNVLGFFTAHQNIKIFVNGEQIYEYPVKQANPFSQSPGYCWNLVTLPNDCKSIQIDITSPYKGYENRIPEIIIGNINSLTSSIINDEVVSCIICVIIFFLGVVMMIFWSFVRSTIDVADNLFSLGVFAILLATWSINETKVFSFLFQNNISTMYIAFTTLMVMPLPFSRFVKSFYEDEDLKWNLFAILNLIQIAVCAILQVLKIADMRDTLWTTHIVYGVLGLMVTVSSIQLILNGTITKKVRLHLICIALCAIAMGFDIAFYYVGKVNSNNLSRISFLIYLLVLGYYSTEESSELIIKGRKAAIYKELAYTDQMTGLFNRTAFTRDFEEISSKPTDVMIINFDLNNLKTINDTLGHTFGDDYIISSATIIKSIFGGIGNCYRVGGDEFVTIIPDENKVNIRDCFVELDKKVKSVSSRKTNYTLAIAHGFAIYEPTLDKNLEDTMKRADKNMYENKKATKEAQE